MPFERSIKQATGSVFKECTSINDREITFPKDPLNILWTIHLFSFVLSCVSSFFPLFLSYLVQGQEAGLCIHSLFIPLLSCLVLTCKTHQYRKDTFFYWMLSVWPCRALGELISPKHCTSHFPSPLSCFSGCPTATAPLLMLAHQKQGKWRSEFWLFLQ